MVILHLLSSWKWTERSEPSVLLARAQQVAGQRIHFVCDRSPAGAGKTVAERARAFGVNVSESNLPKHLNVASMRHGVRELRAKIKAVNPDVIHCHMAGAHIYAALACRRLPRAPLLIRSCYDPDGRELGLRERLARRPAADGFVVITNEAQQRLTRRRIEPRRIAVVEPGIDLERFSASGSSGDNPRERWNLEPDAFVVGMVTRIRRSRGTHFAVELLASLCDELPRLRVLLVGRGTANEIRRSVTDPATRKGVAERLIMAGYQDGNDLVAAYRAMDVLFYPKPGTDRSCRTIREAMASGLPVIAGRDGFIPHLVNDGVTGYLTDLTPGTLAEKTLTLASDRQLRDRMAAAAFATAKERFDLNYQAQRTIDFYRCLLS